MHVFAVDAHDRSNEAELKVSLTSLASLALKFKSLKTGTTRLNRFGLWHIRSSHSRAAGWGSTADEYARHMFLTRMNAPSM